MIPIPKPGKDPSDPGNRRPISLTCLAMKLLGQIIYNRVMHQIEPQLFPGQCAYRRSCSTEQHLAMLMDFAHRALVKRQFVHIVSYDIASAFDRVSHHQLMRATAQFGLDACTRRLLRNWLKGRSFTVQYTSPQCHFQGSRTPITAGLPQGGVLSPV